MPRRCWCSPPRRCGARAFPTAGACTCSNGPLPAEFTDAALVAKYAAMLALARTGHRGDRAAAARQDRALGPRSRSHRARRRRAARVSPTRTSPNCSSPRQWPGAMGDEVTVTRTAHHKCGRCWRQLPEVTEDGALCARCDDVVGEQELRHEHRPAQPPDRPRHRGAASSPPTRRSRAMILPAQAATLGQIALPAAVLRPDLTQNYGVSLGMLTANIGADALDAGRGDQR